MKGIVPHRPVALRCLCLCAGILSSVFLPMRFSEAQTPPVAIPTNTLSVPPPRAEVQANIERRKRLNGKAVIPRERGDTGPLREVPGAQLMGTLEPPTETRPR
jgi:hypothetical protein